MRRTEGQNVRLTRPCGEVVIYRGQLRSAPWTVAIRGNMVSVTMRPCMLRAMRATWPCGPDNLHRKVWVEFCRGDLVDHNMPEAWDDHNGWSLAVVERAERIVRIAGVA